MRIASALFAVAAMGIVAVACSSFSGEDAGGDVDAGGVETGADAATSDVMQQPPVDSAVDAPVAPCADTPTAPAQFASPGAGITNLTSTTAHVFWLLGGNTLQRKGLAAGSAVETISVAPYPITVVAATNDYVVYSSNGGYAVANAQDAGAPIYMGSVGGTFVTAATAVFANSGDTIYRANPPGFFGGVIIHPGVIAMAGNLLTLFYVAPLTDAGTDTAVFKIPNVQSGGQPISAPVYTSPTYHPTQLDVDNTDVFMLDPDKGDVFKAPQSGGAPIVLASGEPDLGRVAVRGQKVYYSTSAGLRRVDAAGGGCKAKLSTDPVVGFTLAGGRVFFVSGSSIVSVPQ